MSNDKGQSPLARAADSGNVEEVAALLADCSIADIDTRDLDGHTPLALAAQNGHASVVHQLLDSGANPNLCDVDYAAPFWYAAKDGHTEVVRLLLASGRLSDVNTLPILRYMRPDETPLVMALKQGHREIVELLAHAKGIDPCKRILFRDDYFVETEKSILQLVIAKGYEDAALVLLDKCTTEPSDSCELLVLAAGSGCERVVRQLLFRYDMNVNTTGIHGDSSLIAASRSDNSGMVRLLLDMKNIQPNLAGRDESTALIEASKVGGVQTVRILIADARVDVNQRDRFGCTALSYAAYHGREEVVAELLAIGMADPNAQDNMGKTPIMHASNPCYHTRREDILRYIGIIHQFMASGQVDINQKDYRGMTSLSIAVCMNWLELVEAILEYPQTDLNIGHPLFMAVSYGYVDVVHMLLQTGRVDVNAVNENDEYRRTPLSLVAGSVHEEVVQLLLSVPGIDVNDTNRSGHIPLLLAAESGNIGIVRLLLAVPNIDTSIHDAVGNALCHAVLFSGGLQACDIMEELLVFPGVQVNFTNSKGQTALTLAAETGNLACIEFLLAIKDVDRNAQDNTGRSPLMWALQAEYPSRTRRELVVRRLLQDPEVDPNARDHAGFTPLWYALQLPHSEDLIELLLARKDFRAETCQGIKSATWLPSKILIDELLRPTPDESLPDSTAAVPSVVDVAAVDALPLDGSTYKESSVSGSSHDKDEFLDDPPSISKSRERELELKSSDKYRLPLGAQKEYIGEWADGKETATALCSVCAAMDLRTAFSSRHNSMGRIVAHLGMIDESWKTRKCPLCRLLYEVRPRQETSEDNTLRSFSMMDIWLSNRKTQCWDKFPDDWIDTMMLCIVPDAALEHASRKGLNLQEQVTAVCQSVFTSGFLCRLGSNCPRQENSIIVPRLAADDSGGRMRTAKSWIAKCRKHHSKRCNPREQVPIPFFRLIDCTTRCIVEQKDFPASRIPKYTALSYVWGQPTGDFVGSQLPTQAEAVIEDAICVTLALGYNCLWVDKYCITQTAGDAASTAMKQTQLQHMNIVYHQAQVTLVAAAGSDASAGLPGAPGRPRQRQYQSSSAVVQGHAIVCIPPDPYFVISKASTWATRGWTYQEGLLSRRRLFFSEYEMSYECRHMLCREALRLPANIEKVTGLAPRLMDALWMYKPQTLPGVQVLERGKGIFALLAEYATRHLSYSSDTLNAMLGVFQLLAERESGPMYQICGVPILNICDDDCVESRERSSIHGFASALCWYLKHPAPRRPNFPSWSWTGWQGVPTIFEHTHFSCYADIGILPRQPDGRTVPWDRYYNQLCAASGNNNNLLSGQYHALEITTSMLTVQLYHNDELDRWIGTACVGNWMWKGRFMPTKEGMESQLQHKLWTGLVLGHDDFNEGNFSSLYLLVVQEQDQRQTQQDQWRQTALDTHTYWERIGLLALKDTTWGNEVLERQTWRVA